MGSYDRWELKLGKKTSSQTAPLVKEWADMVLFANYKTWSVAVDEKGTKRKAQGGARVMHTTHHPCWDAKNRYGLPDEMPFEYDGIRNVIEGNAAQPNQNTKLSETVVTAPEQPAAPPLSEPKYHQETMELEEPPATNTELQKPPTENTEAMGDMSNFPPDMRIPKALRDLMIEYNVCEWDIQNVVEARGYFPSDMNVWDYPSDFIEGVLVGAWKDVYKMIKEAKEKEAIPFN